jgi:hypothetical protein
VALHSGESALLREPVSQLEGRRVRATAEPGGVATTESEEGVAVRLDRLDEGTLMLTTKRIVFRGAKIVRTMAIKDVVAVKAHGDAVEAVAAGQDRSWVFTVENPVLWSRLVKMAAEGQLGIGFGGR